MFKLITNGKNLFSFNISVRFGNNNSVNCSRINVFNLNSELAESNGIRIFVNNVRFCYNTADAFKIYTFNSDINLFAEICFVEIFENNVARIITAAADNVYFILVIIKRSDARKFAVMKFIISVFYNVCEI